MKERGTQSTTIVLRRGVVEGSGGGEWWRGVMEGSDGGEGVVEGSGGGSGGGEWWREVEEGSGQEVERTIDSVITSLYT